MRKNVWTWILCQTVGAVIGIILAIGLFVLLILASGCTGGIILGGLGDSGGGYVDEWVIEDVALAGAEFMSDVGEIEIVDGGSVLLLGWTEISWSEFYPVKIRRRSAIERLVFYTPNERDVVLHEICHSYQMNTVGYSDEVTVLDCIECLKGKRG